jgi:hypothetical protein
MSITLEPGAIVRRKSLHRRYGGSEQGGISPSNRSANLFLFMDKRRGRENGYIYDGKHTDGTLHYTGEGRYGDQQMIKGNRAIRDHRLKGRSLHVFDVQRKGEAHYLGEFVYVEHYPADAPPKGGGDDRKVIVFVLRRLKGRVPLPRAPVAGVETGHWVKEIPIEEQKTERTVIVPDAKPRIAERREQKLVKDLEAWLVDAQHEVCRLELHAAGDPSPIRCDLFDKTEEALYEAKSTTTRAAIRMAIGQLADYARLMNKPPKQRLILVPEKPRADLLDLARTQDLGVIWPDGAGGFASTS